MPTVPLRGVGELGVISDLPAVDLPLNAWQDARNLRFANGNVSRYSVFKTLDSSYSYAKQPVGVFDGGGSFGEGFLVTVFSDGAMEQYSGGTVTAVTPTGTLASSTAQVTSCQLGGVTYANREVDVPIYRADPAGGAYAPIPAWDATWRTRSFRSFKDFLIALNVSKGIEEYPVMVKWSDAAQAGVPPSNWDSTILSSLAGENVLNDCRDELVDGVSLSDTFIIYGKTQTFRMDFIGAPFVFRFQKVFDDIGIMSKNCAVEVDGKHYVFSNKDIIVHDSFNKQSLISGRNYERVFKNIDFEKSDRCFVYHDWVKREIGFAYPSVQNDAAVPLDQSNGCNMAAVYNYQFNTWTFVDLPSAVGYASTSYTAASTWEDTGNWNVETGSWGSYDGKRPSTLVFSSTNHGSVTGQPYFLDDLEGGFLTNSTSPNCEYEAFGTWAYKDLDDLGADLYGRKLIKRIVPQFITSDPDAIVGIQFGQAPNVNADITWAARHQMNVWNEVKYDTRINDRYLAMRIDMPAGVDATLGGFDMDIMLLSRR